MIKYFLILIISFCFFIPCTAQERKSVYDVVRKGKVIGEINLVELIQEQKKFLSMTSHVETSMLLTFTDHTAETAAFDKGIMVYSSFYQKQTGSGVVNKTATLYRRQYKVIVNGESKLIKLAPVRYNTLLLYTNEPVNFNKVYSGSLQKMVDIKKIAPNKYRLMLPDEKYNDYTYKNGMCVKVEVVRSIGTVQFVLREQKL